MYTQIFFVTSVRGMDFPPQMTASGWLSFFGAKMPTPFFFMAIAFFPAVLFSAVIFFNVAFVTVFFVVVVVVVAFVISMEERLKMHASFEP